MFIGKIRKLKQREFCARGRPGKERENYTKYNKRKDWK
jgi:hypothetical protein